MPKPKRAIALILSLSVLIVLGGFLSLAAYQYVSDRIIHQHYENSIRGLYAIEAARNILNWEESQATPPNTWTTLTGVSGTAPTSGTAAFSEATITDGFYKLTGYNGYNIKAKVLITSGNVCMYIQAYKGEEANPQDAQYLEYIHSPSPMYKYAMFSNTSLVFDGSKLYKLNGGIIHTNGDLEFRPGGYGIRFDNLGALTASGTIKYGQRYPYPAPHILDSFDGVIDQMSPAPSLNSDHFQPTAYGVNSGESAVIPGPDRYWYTDSAGVVNLYNKWYATSEWYGFGGWVGNNWGSYGSSYYPLIFRGDETYFYGKQTNNGSYYYTDEIDSSYLRPDGTYGNYSSTNNTNVVNFSLSGSSLVSSARTDGYYNTADVYFNPSTADTWFELPGSLPGSYSWANANKYVYRNSTEQAVTFYATESCGSGSASCNTSTTAGSTSAGWRYIKKDASGNTCTTDSCYTAATSKYVKAKDYVISTSTSTESYATCVANRNAACAAQKDACIYNCYLEQTYNNCHVNLHYSDGGCSYSCQSGYGTYGYETMDDCLTGCEACLVLWSENCSNNSSCSTCSIAQCSPTDITYYETMFNGAMSGDVNTEFSTDYVYGNDIASGTPSTISVLNSKEQSAGFNAYLTNLSNAGVSGVIASGIDKKEPYLGNLFDSTSGGTSAYKTKAQNGGIYLSTDALTSATLPEYASKKYFYNWKTAQLVTVIEIDVAKLNIAIADGTVSFSNGIVYSEVPIMLSNAQNLPGANSGEATAVFTLVSEESVYLKGDYNTDENWEISSIATEKKVYTLSNEFKVYSSDISAVLADTAVYPDYPYVKVTAEKAGGVITGYTGVLDDQTVDASSDSCTGTCVVWVNAETVGYTYTYIDTEGKTAIGYSYYNGMIKDLRDAVVAKKTTLQTDYATAHTETDVNNLDKASYDYNSLFITPYDMDILENWQYQTGVGSDGKPKYAQSTRNLKGAFINFYNPSDSRYDDEYRAALGNSEYCTTSGSCSGGFNYGYRNRKAPWGYLESRNITSPNTVQSYDDRFPTASPTSSEGVLGFTGQDSWRFITKEYFASKT